MENKELFEKVKRLNLPHGKYALFGSAPMGAKGIKDCRDIDIIATADLWEKYKKTPGWKSKKWGTSKLLCRGQIEIWKDWGPGNWNIEELINEAEIIDGLPFVKLERVLEWKKLNRREKDLKDIEAIEKFLQEKK